MPPVCHSPSSVSFTGTSPPSARTSRTFEAKKRKSVTCTVDAVVPMPSYFSPHENALSPTDAAKRMDTGTEFCAVAGDASAVTIAARIA